MRRADTICAGFLLALAFLVMVEGLRLGIGWGTDGPQAGFFPFWLGVGLAVSSLVIVFQVMARAALPRRSFVGPGKLAPVLTVLAPAVGMVILILVLGIYVASALYLGAYMRWIGRHRWGLVVAVSLGVPILTFLTFEKWFLVPLPKGPLEAWLGY
ncbi:MAG: tripartite tricarboxylate transporter TctB family protein [candidate division NC10 bacterium]